MNAPSNHETKTVIPVFEIKGGIFGLPLTGLSELTSVAIEDITRATVIGGNRLVLERLSSAPVLLPKAMNFTQTVLMGRTGITQRIREDRAFTHTKNIFGHDVYYRRGVARAPFSFRPVLGFVRKMMRSNTQG